MKVRIKTEEEFKDEGLWDKEYNYPLYWNYQGEMDYLFGKTVEVEQIKGSRRYRLKDGSDWVIYKRFIAEIIEEKENQMTTQDKIKQLEKELAELKAECNKEYKIEYKSGYTYFVDLYSVGSKCGIYNKPAKYGKYRKSKEEAVRALKMQTRLMRLGALIEDCGGSKEFKEGEANYFIYYINCDKKYGYGHTYNSSCLEKIYASKETIEKVVDILNSGKYQLDA